MRASDSEFRLLVVVPDADRRGSLAATLSLAGYTVTAVATGTAAVRLLRGREVDLVVVDTDIPDVQELARVRPAIAARPPVLCIASCDQVHTIVPEIGAGVEDYVTKPCRPAELLARVRVLLRDRTPARVQVLRYGDLRLDEAACRAWRGDRQLRVTPAEYRLLRHLLRHPGQVLSKEQLAWHVWTEPRGGNAIERLVSRLRLKVDEAGPPLIQTRRGFGYCLGESAAVRA
ncbi:response regulator transcription factor [Actinoplanes sp. KI2]|uniref:response regulator transcription factor n=1 Tax=Actinoplanes sp. KI2 TaxID=2983315 RepID=UPI0021D584FF|nr:response regulator transcription factor [Actinoplanes sp. KI2]MCU7724299.1 response regulator transcription factor [Actinoplanes sp. KI2]